MVKLIMESLCCKRYQKCTFIKVLVNYRGYFCRRHVLLNPYDGVLISMESFKRTQSSKSGLNRENTIIMLAPCMFTFAYSSDSRCLDCGAENPTK